MNRESFSYQLIFYDTKVYPILSIPLNNSTNLIFKIPKDTCFVALNATYLISKDKNINNQSEESSHIYETKNIYFFTLREKIIREKIILQYYDDSEKSIYYFKVPNTSYNQIIENYLEFNNEINLSFILNYLIRIFKEVDIKTIDKDIVYNENKKLKKLEKSLIRRLNTIFE